MAEEARASEWLYEAGIGEARAIRVADGRIAEAIIELPAALRAGTVLEGRLTSILVPKRRGIVSFASGEQALIEPIPTAMTEGAALRVEIVREAIPEARRPKLAKCRGSDAPPRAGPALRERLEARGERVTEHRVVGPDLFEQAGWSELMEEAASGEIDFAGGSLRMSLTPAMTLFDVDGALPAAELAVAGARAAAEAILRFGIDGSIGIDLPTLSAKAERQAAAAAVDAILPQPFERTAVNGFGFLQVVRRRERPSIPELLQADPVAAAARALLRQAERSGGSGERTLAAAPAVAAHLERRPEWLDALSRRVGAPVALRPDPALAISGGHVHSRFS